MHSIDEWNALKVGYRRATCVESATSSNFESLLTISLDFHCLFVTVMSDMRGTLGSLLSRSGADSSAHGTSVEHWLCCTLLVPIQRCGYRLRGRRKVMYLASISLLLFCHSFVSYVLHVGAARCPLPATGTGSHSDAIALACCSSFFEGAELTN